MGDDKTYHLLGSQWVESKERWHGSAYGGPTDNPGEFGVHVGTQEAARQALNARIGHRADGRDWDGTEPHGEALLAGKDTIRDLGRDVTGYSVDAPNHDFYARDVKSDRFGRMEVPAHLQPRLFPVRITGPMTDTIHEDMRANGIMRAQLRRGTARRGYFYKNIAEDPGSISAVVPSWNHLKAY